MSDGQALSPDVKAAYRAAMEFDPWIFSLTVCGRDPKAERHHRPLLYLYTRRAQLLCACLSNPFFDGPITDQIRADFVHHGIDWRDPASLPRVKQRLRRVNIRMPRSSGKSTFADDGDLWDASIDPNLTISIGSKSDPYAWARISAIGEFVRSAVYAFWFPDRVPEDLRTGVTEKAIWLNGRTRLGTPEATIEGRGITSQWTGRHYRKNRRDDMVGTESGEASVSDALRHLANIDPTHDETGWVQDVYVGTINGENDDHAVLSSDENILTVVIPIEVHEGGTTLENIYTEGELTLPEWFDRERVNEIKSNARKNPTEGPIWLLQNYYMAAHKSGTSLVSMRVMSRQSFRWVESRKLGRWVIARPQKGHENTQRDEKKPDFKPSDWFILDPRSLPRTAFASAIDQSVSEDGSADPWAQVLVCADWEGVYYTLDSLSERGYDNLLSQIIPFDARKDRHETRDLAVRPYKIGIDANATQAMTAEWLKRDVSFRDVARRVVEKRSGNERKDINIKNWVIARLLTSEMYVNPDLYGYINEVLKYRPYKADGSRKSKPKDDQLDATWMAMSLVLIPPTPESIAEEEMMSQYRDYEYAKHHDPQTGIITDSWMDVVDWRAA